MKKILFLLFAASCYLIFLYSLVYLIGFSGNIGVANSVDGSVQRPLWKSLLLDGALVVQFAAQHSLMARKWFKKWLTMAAPRPIERSLYVGFSSCSLILLMYFWRPLGGMVWEVDHEGLSILLYAFFFVGWTLVLTASFLINHFDLFGLRQVYLYWQDRPYTALDFAKPLFYKKVRHPLYLGFLIAFWSTPVMTGSHFFFSTLFTLYLVYGIRLEEKDLIADFGERYLRYKRQTPALFPLWWKRSSGRSAVK